jgi:hypothetical protein
MGPSCGITREAGIGILGDREKQKSMMAAAVTELRRCRTHLAFGRRRMRGFQPLRCFVAAPTRGHTEGFGLDSLCITKVFVIG